MLNLILWSKVSLGYQRDLSLLWIFITLVYYMALSHKDWELPNAWIWSAEMDIDRGLEFPI